MNLGKNKKWIFVIISIALVGLWAAKKFLQKNNSSQPTMEKQDGNSYWTCPMHPQIHLNHQGECPICHMKLIQVKSQETQTQESSRAEIQVSSEELNLIGVQRHQVERMDLSVAIPVSGRLLSAKTVAFQVYESDLRNIKPGLKFHGRSSLSEEGDIEGTITSVDSIVDPTSRTVRVVGTIQKSLGPLISETTFSGAIEINLKNRVSIPESAVLHTGKGDLVYIFTNGNKLSPKAVKLGLKAEGFYEILSGLEPGVLISSGPNFLIDSEAKIRGASQSAESRGQLAKPGCPTDQHWDTPMSMCMPGKENK